jgi:tripartite-type tricarboxylate transporter receptor subunit TctC
MLYYAMIAITLVYASPAPAESYPSRPITLVVPFAAGGGTDALGRLVALKLGARLGRSVIVENRPGAGSMLGASAVAKATPDGYTILAVTNSAIAVTPILYKTPLFDPIRDFAPLSMVSGSPFFLAVNPKSPINSASDLIRIAKDRPKALSFSTAGLGSTAHIFMELFIKKAGIELIHVPYGGTAPAVNDVVAGHVDMTFADPTVSIDMKKSGYLKLVGISTKERHPAAPDIPTIAESGLPGYGALAWVAIVAPAHTPTDIAEKLHAEIDQVVSAPEFREFLEKNGSIVLKTQSMDGLRDFFKSEVASWGQILRDASLAGTQ